MGLKKTLIDETTYFELCVSCPVCFDRGVYTERTFWVHQNCGGTIHIGDNANCFCDGCKKVIPIRQWHFRCPNHNNEQEYLMSSTATGGYGMIHAGMMVNETGVKWLHTFMKNLEKF